MRAADLLYATLNPVIRAVLDSPLHGLLSKHVCVVEYAGRRSGRRFRTPLSYVHDGQRVLLLSSRQTRWWKNFIDPDREVVIRIGDRSLTGTARLYQGDSPELTHRVRVFLTQLPRDAMIYKIKLDSNKKPLDSDIAGCGDRVIAVEVCLNY